MTRPKRIAIVGGGLASFVCGIELRDRLPEAEIVLYTAQCEEKTGGQLGSWTERGYPVEHGLHALFGFYDKLLPIVKRVGAEGNFTRSKSHVFVHERGRAHRFDLRTFVARYQGFSLREKLSAARFLPTLAQTLAEATVGGYDVLDRYDSLDFREFFRQHGLPESVLQSNFFRQLYHAPFNEPHQMSAAVGLKTLYRVFGRPYHYYFNHPAREALILPLLRYFTTACRGAVEYGVKTERVRMSPDGTRALALEVVDRRGERRSIEADEFVLAAGLEDLKQIDLGVAGRTLSYFRNLGLLQTVSSVAFQAWFAEDPVPARFDSLINGLPEPLSILCPLSRVRSVGPDRSLPLPFEIAATGPEAGFEDRSDEALVADFLAVLRTLDFRIPEDPRRMHVSLRRNREPCHRYLLTLPGQLNLRPTAQSPIANLCLAGAWIRNSQLLPCADAAAESGIRAASIIAERAGRAPGGEVRSPFVGMPRTHPLVLQPPFEFPDSSAVAFVLDADPVELARDLPPELELAPGSHDKLLVSILDHRDVQSVLDPSGAAYRYQEVLLAAFVCERGRRGPRTFGIHPLALYVNNDTAVAAGREVYGFPKKAAQITLTETGFTVSRLGRAPGAGRGPAEPLDILAGSWSAPGQGEVPPDSWLERALRHGLGGLVASAPLQVAQHLAELPFYNAREMVAPRAGSGVRAALAEVTALRPSGVVVRSATLFQGASIVFGPSANDPIHRLVARAQHAPAVGLRMEFRFTMGDATVVAANGASPPSDRAPRRTSGSFAGFHVGHAS